MIKKLSFYLVALLLAFSSCKSNYDKALKSGTAEVREELAWKYFENKKYFKASPLFKSLLNDYANSPKLEKIFFHYVECIYFREYKNSFSGEYKTYFFVKNVQNKLNPVI